MPKEMHETDDGSIIYCSRAVDDGGQPSCHFKASPKMLHEVVITNFFPFDVIADCESTIIDGSPLHFVGGHSRYRWTCSNVVGSVPDVAVGVRETIGDCAIFMQAPRTIRTAHQYGSRN